MAELTLIQGNTKIISLGGSGDVFVGADNTGLLNKQIPLSILSGKGTFIAGQYTIIDTGITSNSWVTTGLMTCTGGSIRGTYSGSPSKITFTSNDVADVGTFGYTIFI